VVTVVHALVEIVDGDGLWRTGNITRMITDRQRDFGVKLAVFAITGFCMKQCS
jgi:hypothetical protein